MRTALLVTGYLNMTSIGAVALGVMLFLLRDELSARRVRRYYRERESGRPTPRAPQRPLEGGGTQDAPPSRGPLARVGRPARSQQYREWFETTDELVTNLTNVGVILLEQERAR